MKLIHRSNRVPTRFLRGPRFRVQPRFEDPSTAQARGRFEMLKTQLLQPVLSDAPDAGLRHQLRLAANEAAAAAWLTPFPLLVLPVLFEEKASKVHSYASRQAQVQHETRPLYNDAL